MKTVSIVLLVLTCYISGRADTQSQSAPVSAEVNNQYSSLFELYKHLHTNPELSFQEEKTAARFAQELQRAGFKVTEHVGKFGVVGVLENGSGPTVLIRTDLDALPVKEETGLPYASTVTA